MRFLPHLKWGIIPSWSARLPQRPPIINARRETLLELPTFRVPLCHRSGSRRCVVPTTGFYEWHKSPAPANSKPTLTPYLVRKDKGPHHDFSASKSPDQANVVFMAGIYDSVHTSVEDQEVDAYQFVIVTTEASKQFQWLHDRQPVFLSTPQQVALWLNAAIPAQQAISVLNTESRLSWTRMLSDLSQPATGKTMLQRGLDNFMASGGQKKSGEEHLHSAHANDNLQGRPESLATPIRKSGKKKKPAQKDVGQKKITAFFTKRPAPH